MSKGKTKQATKIAKQRRHDREKAIKVVTHITAEQFFDRHVNCINMQDIYKMMEDPEMGVIISENPRAHKAVCDHPEDGYCFHGLPTPEILQKINDKLAFKVKYPDLENMPIQGDSNDLEVDEDDDDYTEPPEDYQRGTVIGVSKADYPADKKFKLKIGGKTIG